MNARKIIWFNLQLCASQIKFWNEVKSWNDAGPALRKFAEAQVIFFDEKIDQWIGFFDGLKNEITP